MTDPLPQTSASLEETWLRLIADTLPAYVAYIDNHLCYRMVNRMYLEQFRRPHAEVVGRPVAEVLGASYENVRGHLEAALQGVEQRFETRMRTGNGERILRVSHIPDRDGTGHVRGLIVHGIDVTESRLAEERLQRSEDRFRLLVDRASIGINIGNEKGELSYMNPALLSLLGYTHEEVRSGDVRWDELTPPEFAGRDREALAQLQATGRAEPYEKLYRAKNGRLVPMLLGATRIPSLQQEDKEDIAVFFTDLTELRRTEAALLQTEKLTAVGKLAAMISHEINNPLEAVTNLLYLARNVPQLPMEALEYLESADRELRRAGQVTTQTLRFHRQSTRPLKIPLHQLVEEVLTLYHPRLANVSVRIERRFAQDDDVTCYESDVRQILNNLVGNAIDALGPNGRLLVRTRSSMDRSTGRKGVTVTIADTGAGMSAEVKKRVAEPFFTTKGINGNGLGLWISRRITEKHGGLLSFRTLPGKGTAFTLWLPSELDAAAGENWI